MSALVASLCVLQFGQYQASVLVNCSGSVNTCHNRNKSQSFPEKQGRSSVTNTNLKTGLQRRIGAGVGRLVSLNFERDRLVLHQHVARRAALIPPLHHQMLSVQKVQGLVAAVLEDGLAGAAAPLAARAEVEHGILALRLVPLAAQHLSGRGSCQGHALLSEQG